jgi:Dolichyl-phosphate-mannose-protein mannosyltransferase
LKRGSQAYQQRVWPAISRPGVPRRLHPAAVLAVLGLLAALARLPIIHNPIDVLPDGCEYLGIACHLIREHRWTSSVKWNFFTPAPVVHPALADRPPLYPLFAAAWVALAPDPTSEVWLARLGNLLLAAAVPVSLYWALEPAVSGAAAALTAFIFMLYPAFLRNSAQPLTEPLFLLLLFGSLGRFLRAITPFDWFMSGLLAGLSFLTRPTGILLPILYTVLLLIQTPGVTRRMSTERRGVRTRRPSRWPALLLVLSAFVLPLVPYGIAVTLQTGSPFSSILRYNYSIRHIDEGTFYGFERSFERPALFVWHHRSEVAGLIARQWLTMGRALGRSLQYLLPLGLFWRRGPGPGWTVLFAFALLNIMLHALSWTVWGAARYLFPTYIISMALLLDAPLRWVRGRGGEGGTGRVRTSGLPLAPSHPRSSCPSPPRPLAPSPPRPLSLALAAGTLAAGVGLTLSACLQQDMRLYREKSGPFAGVPLGWAYAAAGKRLAQTPPGAVCAANQPWIVNLLARRPAVMAPRFRDPAQLRRYLACYRPDTLILFITEDEPRDVAAASRLVTDLWTRPALRREVAGALELDTVKLRTARAPRQALLIFRPRSKLPVTPTTVPESRGDADGR